MFFSGPVRTYIGNHYGEKVKMGTSFGHQGHRTLDILLSMNIFFISGFSFKNQDLDGRGTLTKVTWP